MRLPQRAPRAPRYSASSEGFSVATAAGPSRSQRNARRPAATGCAGSSCENGVASPRDAELRSQVRKSSSEAFDCRFLTSARRSASAVSFPRSLPVAVRRRSRRASRPDCERSRNQASSRARASGRSPSASAERLAARARADSLPREAASRGTPGVSEERSRRRESDSRTNQGAEGRRPQRRAGARPASTPEPVTRSSPRSPGSDASSDHAKRGSEPRTSPTLRGPRRRAMSGLAAAPGTFVTSASRASATRSTVAWRARRCGLSATPRGGMGAPRRKYARRDSASRCGMNGFTFQEEPEAARNLFQAPVVRNQPSTPAFQSAFSGRAARRVNGSTGNHEA